MSTAPNTTGPLNIGGIAWYAGLSSDASASGWSDLYGSMNATLVGTPTGTTGFAASTRTGGYDVEYDWSNNLYFETGISADIDTLAFWFKAINGGEWNGLMCQAADDNSGFQIRQNGGHGDLAVKVGGTDTVISAAPFDGTWRHLALVRDTVNAQTIVYLNGVTLTNIPGAWATSSTLAIGTRSDRALSFVGALDDIRIWGRALSPDEIAQVFSPPQTLVTTTTAASRAWLPPRPSMRAKGRAWPR